MPLRTFADIAIESANMPLWRGTRWPTKFAIAFALTLEATTSTRIVKRRIGEWYLCHGGKLNAFTSKLARVEARTISIALTKTALACVEVWMQRHRRRWWWCSNVGKAIKRRVLTRRALHRDVLTAFRAVLSFKITRDHSRWHVAWMKRGTHKMRLCSGRVFNTLTRATLAKQWKRGHRWWHRGW